MPPLAPIPHRSRSPRPLDLAALACGLIIGTLPGCGRERRQITPTTTGTDLRAMPRGRMTPLPFPGSSLARSENSKPTADPATTSTSAAPR